MNISKKEYILAAEAKGFTSSQANKMWIFFKKQNKIIKHDSSYLNKLKKLSRNCKKSKSRKLKRKSKSKIKSKSKY